MRIYNFSGGINLNNYGSAGDCRIERFIPKEKLRFGPGLSGKPFVPLVKAGDHVLRCQVLAVSADDKAQPVLYSPVSGTVSDLITYDGGSTIIIENDGEYKLYEGIKPHGKKLSETSPEELISKIEEAAVFDAVRKKHVSDLTKDALGRVRTLVINCIESEPYSSSVRRLVIEHTNEIINGAKILMKAIGVISAVIAAPDLDSETVNTLLGAVKNSTYIKVNVLKSLYPQGMDSVISYSLTGTECPPETSCEDSGLCVIGAEACAAVYRVFAMGLPMTDRLMTVDGDCVKKPHNLFVPIGTRISELAAFCGADLSDIAVYDRGIAAEPLDDPGCAVITQSTRTLIFMSAKKKKTAGSDCIRCGRCTSVCPARIIPFKLAGLCLDKKYNAAQKAGLDCCLDCAACEIVCPSDIPLMKIIREAKNARREGEAQK